MGLPLRYNYRNMFRRKLRSVLTMLGIALVIAIAVIMMAYGRGILYAVRNNGDPENVLVLSRRATDRTFSSLKKGEFEVLAGLVDAHVAFHPPLEQARSEGDPIPVDLVVPYVQHASLVRIEGVEGGRYGLRKLGMIQGVDPDRAFHVHRRFKLLTGRRLSTEDEKVAMVGSLAWARLGVRPEDLAVGKVLRFNGATWPIVGVFDTAGSSADGEIWVPIEELMTVLNRPDYSYAVLKAASPAAREAVLQLVNRSEQTELRAIGEADYYRGFAETFRTFAVIAGVMALIITAGGVMVGMNTMYTAVSGRVREIGMLQVIGFSKRAVVVSFVLESVLIALVGGVAGCALGRLANGVPMKVTMGVFLFRVDALVLALGLGLTVFIGVFGALVPAWRAVRLRMVDAMRYV